MKKNFLILGIGLVGVAGLSLAQYTQLQPTNANPITTVTVTNETDANPVVDTATNAARVGHNLYAEQLAFLNVYVVALEPYAIDNMRLPAYTFEPDRMIYGERIASDPNSPSGFHPTFMRLSGGNSLAPFTLSTPLAYVPSLTGDRYWPTNTPVLYVTKDYSNGDQSYLLWSTGPDLDYDLNHLDWMVSLPDFPDYVILAQYDPTNGAVSSGDILKNGFANWSDLPARMR